MPKSTFASGKAWSHLLQICGRRRFEPHRIGHLVDKTGRYDEALDREFPFLIRLFRYTSRRYTPGMTWHERLELFLPLDGPARFQMGDEVVELGAGDLLVVDNLKLHRVLDFPGFNTRVIVVSFMPEFVYSLGSPSHDYAFLLPFYAKIEKRPHLVRASDGLAGAVYQTLGELVACYFQRAPFFQAGCKAICLRLLHHLATRFQTSEILKSEFLQQQERSRQLTRLLDHISQHYSERLTLTEAARMAGMSPPKFTKVFKLVAGMTLVNYVTHVRLSHAARLLRETTRSVAEIASAVGFADQSYFDRRFRGSFGQTPLRYRSGLVGRAPVSTPGQNGGRQ